MEKIDNIAKVFNEAYRGYLEASGDNSRSKWNECSDVQRELIISMVKYLIRYPKSTPEEIHEYWKTMKELAGWNYGKEKNKEKKIHPAFISYDKLRLKYKVKYHLLINIVRAHIN